MNRSSERGRARNRWHQNDFNGTALKPSLKREAFFFFVSNVSGGISNWGGACGTYLVIFML